MNWLEFHLRSLAELEQKTSRLTSEFQQTIENLSMRLEEQKQIVQVDKINSSKSINEQDRLGTWSSTETINNRPKTIIWKVKRNMKILFSLK